MKTLLFLALAAALPAAEKPNIVLMLSDDQDWAGLSVAMHPEMPGSKSPVIRTPNLERFAAQGMRFSAGYAPAPVCSPTRISLQTGMTPARLRWTTAAPNVPASQGLPLLEAESRRRIDDRETTIAEMLKTAGYATAHYGKWHLEGGGPERHGYDESDGETGNESAAPFNKADNPDDIIGMAGRAATFMKKSKEAGKPFFIQLSWYALHYPENARSEMLAKYRGLMPGGNEKTIERAAITEDLDGGVGKVLASLAELGLSSNTWVIYLSDNGGGGGGGGGRKDARGIQGGKGSLYEGGIRVPFIVRGPSVKPGSWCHQRVTGFDLFPTFCQLAGVTRGLPVELDGGSLLPLLRGEDVEVKRPREELVFHFPHYQGAAPHSAIYLGDHKLLKFHESGELKLYDIAKDPGERSDLVRQMPDKAAELEKRLNAYLAETKAALPKPNPAAVAGKQFDPKEGKGGKGKGRPGRGRAAE